jgi:hypothetical protein
MKLRDDPQLTPQRTVASLICQMLNWCRKRDSNPRPHHYE